MRELTEKIIFVQTPEEFRSNHVFIWRNRFLTEGTTKAKVMRQKQVHSKNKEITVPGVRKGREADEVGGGRFYDLVDNRKDFGF